MGQILNWLHKDPRSHRNHPSKAIEWPKMLTIALIDESSPSTIAYINGLFAALKEVKMERN